MTVGEHGDPQDLSSILPLVSTKASLCALGAGMQASKQAAGQGCPFAPFAQRTACLKSRTSCVANETHGQPCDRPVGAKSRPQARPEPLAEGKSHEAHIYCFGQGAEAEGSIRSSAHSGGVAKAMPTTLRSVDKGRSACFGIACAVSQ